MCRQEMNYVFPLRFIWKNRPVSLRRMISLCLCGVSFWLLITISRVVKIFPPDLFVWIFSPIIQSVVFSFPSQMSQRPAMRVMFALAWSLPSPSVSFPHVFLSDLWSRLLFFCQGLFSPFPESCYIISLLLRSPFLTKKLVKDVKDCRQWRWRRAAWRNSV